MVFWPPTHSILNPLPMVFWPTIQSISNSLSMVYWTPYPWYIEPPSHGILNPLPIVYRTPYPWYIKPPIHLLIRNEGAQNTMGVQFTIQGGGGQFSIRGFNIPWKKINPGSIYHMTPGQLPKIASSWICNFCFYSVFFLVTESALTNIFFNRP